MFSRFSGATLAIAALLGLAAAPAFFPSAVPAEAGDRRATLEPSMPVYTPRFGRSRPVIAILGYNESTEVTDYVVPYGILADADVADVLALSTGPGPISMRPALRFEAGSTTRNFDLRYPDGADYVVVPNIYEGANDRHVLDWLRTQASLGAVIVGICDGVPTVANAGLLVGRRATGHWRSIDELERRHAATEWIRNRRYVADGNVITTSGVSASISVSVALVEAIAGHAHAQTVAERLGVEHWGPQHDSEQFRLGGRLFTALANKTFLWHHERLGVPVGEAVDEISLALTADAWSRTRRSWACSVAESPGRIRTRRGLTLIPDLTVDSGLQPETMLPPPLDDRPARALDDSLAAIEARFGRPTAAFVALQVEYAWPEDRGTDDGVARRVGRCGHCR